MSRPYYRRTSPPVSASPCCRNHYASDRSKFKYLFLRPSRRGRSHLIPTPILVLWPPRSVHPHPPWIWHDFPHRCVLLRQKRTFRLHGHGLSHDGYWPLRLHCMSPSHVYSRHGCRYPGLLYIRHNNYRHPNRRKSL